MSRLLLRLEHFSAGYQAPVFAPLSLQLRAGECVGLSGANGAGKSTLLHALLGQAQVWRGSWQLASGLQVALQPQRVRLPQPLPMTAAELVRLGQAPPLPPELAAWASVRLDYLSGGAWQQVSSWVTLHGPAQLALLDEPTNNLDSTGLARLTAWLKPRPERGVLVVSHDQAWLKRVCQRRLTVRAA